MSEKIYACLLRLFPSHFREAYGEEARQLFRDRARDEKGFLPRVRLWLDLLADLAISVPRQYRDLRPAFTSATAQQRLEGAPAFFVLVDESPGAGPLILGCALSMMALSLFSILLVHAGNRRPPSASTYQRGYATSSRPSDLEHPAGKAPGDAQDLVTNASRTKPSDAKPNDSQSGASLASDSSRSPKELSPQLQDVAAWKRVIDAVIQNLKKHYVDAEVAKKTSDALLAHDKNGDDDKVTDGRAFANLLTKQIRQASHDMHLAAC